MSQTTSKQKIEELMQQAQTVQADDPDMLDKLNQIAQEIAKAQGKQAPKKGMQSNAAQDAALVDPMDELGCEGCQ